MPNEFEKQVQQMMDELKLVPSEPVWQKVEMQIRKKKDRRRLVLWLLFLGLLLGGGLWIRIDHYSNDVAYQKPNDESQTQRSITTSPRNVTNQTTKTITNKEINNNKISESKKKIIEKLIVDESENKNDAVLKNEINDKPNKDVNAKGSLLNQAVTRKQPPQKIEVLNENLLVKEENMPVKNEDTVLSKAKTLKVIIMNDQLLEKLNHMVISFDIIQNTGQTSTFPFDKMPIKPTLLISDSVKHDTTLIKKPESEKLVASKWKLNFVAASGISGLSRLNFFNGLKSADARYYYSPSTNVTGPGIIYYGPSEVRKGLSFSIGGSAQRQLSKRFQFSVGLQYNYYSNSILVGNRISRDTMFRAYPVSQYFTNAARAYSYSIAAESYHNHYHFISLPVSIRWQMSKNLPLYFYTGFSVQQMIQTNALVFDYNAQAYYHSNKAFNKTQVFTEYGFNYSIPFNKKYFTVGPEFQYGLPSLEKNNSTHHLFSYGLKLQLQLNKK